MIAVTYKIILKEPLLATSLNGDPNSSVSYDAIPGSMIRGLAAARMVNIGAMSDEVRGKLFDGRTRFLNAYPADAHWRRGLPAPLSWTKEKDRLSASGKIQDQASMRPTFRTPTGVGKTFMWLIEDEDETMTALRNPERHISIHTLRRREAGRPTKSEGAVYRYDALAANECFVGAILVPDEAAGEALKKLLPAGAYRLGGSATAGYGRVHLQDVVVNTDWHEYPDDALPLPKGRTFSVLLLSNVILRDELGSNHSHLEKALDAQVELIKAFKSTEPVGGFNRTWGLPLPQDIAVSAGSLFVLRAQEDISRDRVEQWLENGVGERTVEGFGRIAVDWPVEAELIQVAATTVRGHSNVLTLTESARELAERMVTRRRRNELDIALVKAINNSVIRHAPSNSQLSRIRIIARSALQEHDLSRIGTLMKREIENQDGEKIDNPDAMKNNSLKKFEAARVAVGGGAKQLSQWLIELADNPTGVWDYLGGDHRVSLGTITAQSWMAEEYAVRLIDGVFDKAIKRTKGGG